MANALPMRDRLVPRNHRWPGLATAKYGNYFSTYLLRRIAGSLGAVPGPVVWDSPGVSEGSWWRPASELEAAVRTEPGSRAELAVNLWPLRHG